MNIGSKVVCVDSFFADTIAVLFNELPVEGRTYVIRGIHEGNSLDDGAPQKCVTLLLVGLTNPSPAKPGAKERGFNANRFRPLDEVKASTTEKLTDCVGREM